jgi:hypothetical protein
MEKGKLPVSFKLSLLLFFISVQCLLAALYLKERENYSKLESQLTGEPEAAEAALKTAEQARRPDNTDAPIQEAALDTQASSETLLAGAVQKKDGTLWFDKQNSSYVVTIGRKNGINEGDTLKIYDSTEAMGDARVVRSMEKISIVEISDTDRQKLTKAYYKVTTQ